MTAASKIFGRYRVASNPLRAERRVELALLCAVLLLLLAVLYAAARVMLSNRVGTLTPAADSLRIASIERSANTSAQDSLLLLARPIFWEGRRPLESEGAAALQAAMSEQDSAQGEKIKTLELLGIYGAGDAGGAILRVDDKQQRLAVGDRIKGWTLAEVTPDSATFVSGAARDVRTLLARAVPAAAASDDRKAARAKRQRVPKAGSRVRVKRNAKKSAEADPPVVSRALGLGGN